MAIIASIPLFSVLYMLIVRGGSRLSWEALTELPPAGFEMGGGFGNAIVGTFVMVGIAAAISVPVGILCAIFLAELGPDSKLANAVRFAAKTLTGFPSILAGVFAYAAVVLLTGGYSAPAGGVALAVLMVPTVILTAEEAMTHGAEDHEGRRLRHGLHPHAGDPEDRAADRDAGRADRRDARGGARRRRDGAAALHGAVLELLAVSTTASSR